MLRRQHPHLSQCGARIQKGRPGISTPMTRINIRFAALSASEIQFKQPMKIFIQDQPARPAHWHRIFAVKSPAASASGIGFDEQ
jgi:hypothetical protein